MASSDWIDRFAFWEGVHPDLVNFLTYGAGIAAYTVLVFACYQRISRREPEHTKLRKGWWGRTLNASETIFAFPLISFGYFAILSLSLFLLSKPSSDTAQILLLSMSAVLGVRVTAHVSEAMSNDIAKLLPLSLLAVVLVEPGYLGGLDVTLGRIGETLGMVGTLFQYFVIFILVEAALRGVRAFVPSVTRFTSHMGRRRGLSKHAMLKDIEGEHESHLFSRSHHHEHAPRDRTHDFLSLDESSGGKPNSGQGVGPAIRHEMKRAHAPAAPHAHRPRPAAGPGGKGGKIGSW